MSIKDISKLVENLKALEIMKEELTGEIDSIKDELKQKLKRRETEEMLAGIYKIRYKTVTSSRFDTTAFKKAQPEIYATYYRKVESKRFTVAYPLPLSLSSCILVLGRAERRTFRKVRYVPHSAP